MVLLSLFEVLWRPVESFLLLICFALLLDELLSCLALTCDREVVGCEDVLLQCIGRCRCKLGTQWVEFDELSSALLPIKACGASMLSANATMM